MQIKANVGLNDDINVKQSKLGTYITIGYIEFFFECDNQVFNLLEKLDSEISENGKSKDELESEVEGLKEQLADLEGNIEDIKDDYEDKMSDLNNEIEELKDEIETLETELSELKRDGV